jgi:CRISPR-associated endonuclease/helicase Cas3
MPRRLVYVVDRRAVVDQATGVAESLREWVAGERDAADALGLDGRPLPISTLRGQHVDNRAWLEDPSSPAIIVGTVDMVGSRLLFSGYGVSSKMRPYHAGLLGADTLVVLDEAHLVPAFESLLRQIERGSASFGPREPALRALVPLFKVMSLSATGRQRQAVLTLSAADHAHPVVAQRLGARKRLLLREPASSKELPQRLADDAWLLSGGDPVRIIVFASSRDVAQKVSELLEKRGGTVELFVGARRVYERTQVAAWLQSNGFAETAGGQRAAPDTPTFLVATSAGEVGIDMDADHMVSDLVAWERMVQRLGRVNRRGRGDAQVIVVPEEGARDEERLTQVRTLLLHLPRLNDGHDVSPGALAQLKAAFPDAVEAASTPAPLHPPLSRAVVESWSMTSLEEHRTT